MDARERVKDDTLRALERANAELRRENARLARDKLGTSDAAAASLLGRLQRAQRELKEAQKRLKSYDDHAEAERARDEWIADLHSQIKQLKRVIEHMESTRVWQLGSVYWRTRNRLTRRSSGGSAP
jgi:hypothetical protein